MLLFFVFGALVWWSLTPLKATHILLKGQAIFNKTPSCGGVWVLCVASFEREEPRTHGTHGPSPSLKNRRTGEQLRRVSSRVVLESEQNHQRLLTID